MTKLLQRERAWASMEATWASLEKAELKEKLMTARRERAERGLPNGGPAPYGYSRPVSKGPLVIDEQEELTPLARLRLATTARASSHCSLSTIAG